MGFPAPFGVLVQLAHRLFRAAVQPWPWRHVAARSRTSAARDRCDDGL